eukprot:1150743-Pelagomonas_calceolata.AAC.2
MQCLLCYERLILLGGLLWDSVALVFVISSIWGQTCCVAGRALYWLMLCVSGCIRRVVLVLGGLAVGAGLGLIVDVHGRQRAVISCPKAYRTLLANCERRKHDHPVGLQELTEKDTNASNSKRTPGKQQTGSSDSTETFMSNMASLRGGQEVQPLIIISWSIGQARLLTEDQHSYLRKTIPSTKCKPAARALVKIKYCEDARPEQYLKVAQRQHTKLCNSISGKVVTLHTILLGVGGTL